MGRFVGTADLPNFFRKPYGPGWVLVGDAGYHKDPYSAQGIMDAFRDVELIVEAIDAGFSERLPLEEALASYERQRNEMALPLYEYNTQAASMKPPHQRCSNSSLPCKETRSRRTASLASTRGRLPPPSFSHPRTSSG